MLDIDWTQTSQQLNKNVLGITLSVKKKPTIAGDSLRSAVSNTTACPLWPRLDDNLPWTWTYSSELRGRLLLYRHPQDQWLFCSATTYWHGSLNQPKIIKKKERKKELDVFLKNHLMKYSYIKTCINYNKSFWIITDCIMFMNYWFDSFESAVLSRCHTRSPSLISVSVFIVLRQLLQKWWRFLEKKRDKLPSFYLTT